MAADSHGIKVARGVRVSGERKREVTGNTGSGAAGAGATGRVAWVRLVVEVSRERYFAGQAGGARNLPR